MKLLIAKQSTRDARVLGVRESANDEEARWIEADLHNANKRNTDSWRERDLYAAWQQEARREWGPR